MAWNKNAKTTATWLSNVKTQILNGFLLMEDGHYLLQENSAKIIISLGWNGNVKNITNWVKVGK